MNSRYHVIDEPSLSVLGSFYSQDAALEYVETLLSVNSDEFLDELTLSDDTGPVFSGDALRQELQRRAKGRRRGGSGSEGLVLQRHIVIRAGEAAFPMAAPGLGLAFATPAGPVQEESLRVPVAQHHGQQALHLRDGERDQVASIPPFAPCAALARVAARNA